ncbi:MAG: nickel-dependent hydrogenase large subunit [Thiohalocapsa sp.]
MTDLSGKIDIDLHRDRDRLAVSIRSSRPVTAARVFAGRPLLEVARRLPMLFSICATAQAQACAGACEQALGLTASASTRERRTLLLRAETVKEHLWRLLLDWPTAMGETPAHEPMARAMRAYLELRRTLTTDADPFVPGADTARLRQGVAAHQTKMQIQALGGVIRDRIFGMPPRRWLEQIVDRDALLAWSSSADTVAADLLRQLLRADLAGFGRNAVESLTVSAAPELAATLAGSEADAFLAAPTWQGCPRETTPFARCCDRPLIADLAGEHGNGLLPRLAALLLELADAMVALVGETPSDPQPDLVTQEQVGIGVANAARGLLIHRVELADGRVTSYRILAPTEWHFHPNGVVAAGLSGSGLHRMADQTELKRRAALYVTAVDPCVAYAISVS